MAEVLVNLTTAFFTRFTEVIAGSHNTFYELIQGRMYEDQADDGAPFPYAVYRIIASPKDRTFSEEFRETIIQLSLFSITRSSSEIKAIYYAASTLYDECLLTITGSTLLWLRETNLVEMVDEIITPDGTAMVRHYAVDFECYTSLT